MDICKRARCTTPRPAAQGCNAMQWLTKVAGPLPHSKCCILSDSSEHSWQCIESNDTGRRCSTGEHYLSTRRLLASCAPHTQHSCEMARSTALDLHLLLDAPLHKSCAYHTTASQYEHAAYNSLHVCVSAMVPAQSRYAVEHSPPCTSASALHLKALHNQAS